MMVAETHFSTNLKMNRACMYNTRFKKILKRRFAIQLRH